MTELKILAEQAGLLDGTCTKVCIPEPEKRRARRKPAWSKVK